MKKLQSMIIAVLLCLTTATSAAEYKKTITVSRDGTGDFRTLTEAMEAIRAFMDYTVTVHIKDGVYKEKVVVPSWIDNVEFIGESVEGTIITYDDHANINRMGTFRTYTLKVEGSGITFRNLTIENNAAQKGQAVALHTEGDRLMFINCRILGNQDTIYTGAAYTRLYFYNCYIEGTTDYIFGPSTAMFKNCTLHCKRDSYITAASTPKDVEVGYVFIDCKITASDSVTKMLLGRPWRPYAHTAFINCEMGSFIRPLGWNNWGKPDNEQSARYQEYNSKGEGANPKARQPWSKQLSKKEAEKLMDPAYVFKQHPCAWNPVVE